MNVLDQIKTEIGAAFSDPELFFSPAILTRPTGDGGGWTDEPSAPEVYPCMAMVGKYNDHLRAVADIPDTHVKLMIVGTSIAVPPLKGDSLAMNGKTWMIFGPVQTDPAGAMWTAQAVAG